MRLLLSTTDHTNTDISDERGHVQYTVSTPRGTKRVTTITKHRWSGSNSVPETMGVIEWHRLKDTMLKFDGKTMTVDQMFERRSWETGRYFVGPDRRKYKWKMESGYCWMKSGESGAEFVRFHRKNHGIMKPQHPAYLEVSPKALHMLDHIVLTFVYIESLRQERARSQSNSNAAMAASAAAAAVPPPPSTC